MKKSAAILLLPLVVVACASTQKRDTEVASSAARASADIRQVAYEQEAAYVAELKFKKGSDELTVADRRKIKRMMREAEAAGKISEVKVISWADQEYPTAQQKKLDDEQIELAKNRNREISNFVLNSPDAKGVGVAEYSMAQRPSVFQKIFKTEDARLKYSLEEAGIPKGEAKDKRVAKASRSVVMVFLKEE